MVMNSKTELFQIVILQTNGLQFAESFREQYSLIPTIRN